MNQISLKHCHAERSERHIKTGILDHFCAAQGIMPFLPTLLEKKGEVEEKKVSTSQASFHVFFSFEDQEKQKGKVDREQAWAVATNTLLLGGDGLVTSQASSILNNYG